MRRRQNLAHPSGSSFVWTFGSAFLDGWFVTLILGGLHSTYHQIPPIGYWWCVGIVFILSGIMATPISARDMRRDDLV